jgi:predicted GH43/DUF377 family glycosyl hydrolase
LVSDEMNTFLQDVSALTEGERWFNNSICRIGDEVWMAYRREHQAAGVWSDIWVVALDDYLQPITGTNIKIGLPRPHPDTGLFEDPRLFMVGRDIYLSFIAATIEKNKHCAAQGIARLTGSWKVASVSYPAYGHNINDAVAGNGVGKGEKNWTFYEHKGAVRCLYSLEPCEVIEVSGDRCFPVAETWSNPDWGWGRLSGSTPLIPYEGKLLGMGHSFLHSATRQRDYYAFWYVFCPQENRLTHLSKQFVMAAEPNVALDLRGNQWWRPNAIFPCGLIPWKDGYAMSYGWQDSLPMVATFTQDEVEESLRPLGKWQQVPALKNILDPLPGGFCFTIGEKVCKAHSWARMRKWCKLNGVSLEDAEAAICTGVEPKYKTTKLRRIE